MYVYIYIHMYVNIYIYIYINKVTPPVKTRAVLHSGISDVLQDMWHSCPKVFAKDVDKMLQRSINLVSEVSYWREDVTT